MATTQTCEPKWQAISGIEHGVNVCQLIDAPTHGEGYGQLGGYPLHHVGECLASLVTGGDVKKHKLVGILLAVRLAQLYGVAGIAQIDEVCAFDGLAVLDVKAWYYSLGE